MRFTATVADRRSRQSATAWKSPALRLALALWVATSAAVGSTGFEFRLIADRTTPVPAGWGTAFVGDDSTQRPGLFLFARDLAILSTQFGQPGSTSAADLDNDDDVDLADLALLLAGFGAPCD